MIENYLKYLAMLDEKLQKFFISQKPFIFCKPGCSKCCKNAQYPYSKIEFELVKIGVVILSCSIVYAVLNIILKMDYAKELLNRLKR